MADSQSFDQIPNSTLTKLLEVDSELAVQEAELLSQLESVQEKRKSLKTVISMFTTVDNPATAPVEIQTLPAKTSKIDTPTTAPVETGNEIEEPVGELAALPLDSAATATAESETEAVTDTQSKVAKKTLSSPTRTNKNTKFRQTKSPNKASGWQDYVREEFSGNSLPEAVHTVLQRGADRVFEIPAIVNAIFEEHLPMDVGSKARRQVTNILSEGARKNKWYRGQIGYYSISRAVADQAKYS